MEFSPFDSQHFDDPYPVYKALRAQDTLHFSKPAWDENSSGCLKTAAASS